MQILLITLLLFLSVFMIVLVLIQRGKGGGLAGAFGGMGGQSAFGTKAGDVFTRITVVTAVLWFLLCCFTILFLGGKGCGSSLDVEGGGSVTLPMQGGASSAPSSGSTESAPTSTAPISTAP